MDLRGENCEVHRPFKISNDEDEFDEFYQCLSNFTQYIIEEENIIDLSGVSWRFNRDIFIEDDSIFGLTNAEISSTECKLILLHDCKAAQNITIRNLHNQDLQIDLSYAEVYGSIYIRDSEIGSINLHNAIIHGNIQIISSTFISNLDLRSVKVDGAVEISSNSRVCSQVSFSGATIKRSFEIHDVEFGISIIDGSSSQLALGSNGSGGFKGIQMDDAFDQSATKFGSLTLKRVSFYDRCDFGRVDVERYLDFSDVKFLGGLSFDRASVINDSIIRDLTITLPRNASLRAIAETRRAIRAFREIARASGNTVASSRLIREERAILSTHKQATRFQSALWRLHDLVSESNLSWELPASFLIGQAVLFASLISLFLPPSGEGLLKALALSLANTFAPFVSLQVSILVGDMPAIILSIFQSAISAGLISALIMSIRESSD